MVAPLKLNVRLPRVRVYSVEPLRGLVKPRNKLREFGTDDLCRGRLVEVAAGGLAQSAHDLAHLLLGRGTQLGDNLLNQGLELLARNLRGQQALQNLDLLGQVVGTLLVGAGLDGHLQRLARLLNQTLDHAVDVFLGSHRGAR